MVFSFIVFLIFDIHTQGVVTTPCTHLLKPGSHLDVNSRQVTQFKDWRRTTALAWFPWSPEYLDGLPSCAVSPYVTLCCLTSKCEPGLIQMGVCSCCTRFKIKPTNQPTKKAARQRRKTFNTMQVAPFKLVLIAYSCSSLTYMRYGRLSSLTNLASRWLSVL